MPTQTTIDSPSLQSNMPALQRDALLALIKTNATQLADMGDGDGLEVLMEDTGYISNLSEVDIDEMAAAIVALAGVVNEDTLGHVAAGAVFYRLRAECAQQDDWYHSAIAAARAAVEPLGVKYNSCGCLASLCDCARSSARNV